MISFGEDFEAEVGNVGIVTIRGPWDRRKIIERSKDVLFSSASILGIINSNSVSFSATSTS